MGIISEEVKMKVYIRDKKRCAISGDKEMLERTPHHCFFRSEYFEKDKDEEWNLIIIGMKWHNLVHFAKDDKEIEIGKRIEKKCKEMALSRYQGKFRKKLEAIMKSKYRNNWIP